MVTCFVAPTKNIRNTAAKFASASGQYGTVQSRQSFESMLPEKLFE
jgi:hypothetical protein